MDSSQPSSANPTAALDQVFSLLKAKDDTSRFVGLSLLRSLLDSNEELRSNTAIITQCWNSIPNTFLIKLLESQTSKKKKSDEETRDLITLAISVVNIFANLVPQEEIEKEKMTEFCEPLIHVIPQCDQESQDVVFQVLRCIANSPKGATSMNPAKDWNWLDIAAKEKPVYYLKELGRLFGICYANFTMSKSDLRNWHDRLAIMIQQMAKENPAVLIETLADLSTEMPYLSLPDWPPDPTSLLPIIRTAIMTRPATKLRYAVVTLVANLLRQSDNHFSALLFNDTEQETRPQSSQPFSYVFINLLLIDIRTTIPSLMEILASPEYATTAIRLAASYDITTSFIMYLLQNSEPDTEITDNNTSSILPPDLLLKLRRDFSETFSLTLELFRDRWESAVTGASGLDPTARRDPETPLALTWDNPTVSPSEDPIILSGLRALSLWLREDDNPQLNEQAIGIMDMLIPLYSGSMGTDAKVDFIHPILTALCGIFPDSEDAVQAFLDEKGWDVLSKDLKQCFTQQVFPAHTQDLIRVLLMVVESDSVPQTQQSWMDIVRVMAKYTVPSVRDIEAMETLVGGWQLAVALILKAPRRVRKEMAEEVGTITRKAGGILDEAGERLEEGVKDGLQEIIEGFDGIS
ncbi:DUF1941-domain-containing protein [Tothia fuscella]|uniref:DUF1941-domain-containing protein n=1 Tax=Tothia fuscella TaxID=1048955 RepID=A0A9P4U1C9_9PEZI|nr:DUF1941-domain-containing protein [Tothia fuscella]